MAHHVAFVDSLGDVFGPITDTFTRITSDGWGTADTGETWTTSGGAASDYATNGTLGTVSVGAVASARRILIGTASEDWDVTVSTVVSVLATGAPIEVDLMLRRVDTNNYYLADLQFNTDQTMNLRLRRVVGGSFTTMTDVVTGLTHATVTTYRLRARIQGQVMQARAWDAAGSEPSTWATTAGSIHITAAGQVGPRINLATGNTNTTPVTISFDNFTASSATSTRLDLNDGSTWTTLDSGTEFPPPPLKRAVVSTLLVDGAHVAAAAYDNRMLKLRLNLQAATEDASALALQNLFREIDRPRNILMFQPSSASNPVFFRTFRSDASAVREVLPSGSLRELEVTLWAEPFAYGVRQAHTSAAVTNDPASGCYFDMTSVKGDVETPLMMTIEFGDVDDEGPTAIAVRRRGTPSATPFLLQAEAMTGGTNTTIQANDPVMSGAGQNFMRCTFGTSSMQDRLTSAVHPTTASVDARGTYRVFLRGRKATAGDTISVELKQTSGTTTATNTEVTWPAGTTNRRYVDLGLVQIPFGPDPIYDGLSNVEAAARGSIFTVRAERSAGSGNFDFDCLIFVPADDRFCLITWPTSSGPTSMLVDGTTDHVYPLGAAGEIYPLESCGRTGSLPMITPGVTNRIYFVLNAAGNASAVSDDITSSTDITAAYYPRYLYVRPAST